MSFGYSVGDCITGANLTYRLIKALSNTRGASHAYQEAMAELSSLQQTFLLVSQMQPGPFLDAATINAASCIVLSSMELIGQYLDRTNAYRKRLSVGSKTAYISDSWQKIGWALFKDDELIKLRDVLHSKLSHINLLLSAANLGQGLLVDAGTTSRFQVLERPKAVSAKVSQLDSNTTVPITDETVSNQQLHATVEDYISNSSRETSPDRKSKKPEPHFPSSSGASTAKSRNSLSGSQHQSTLENLEQLRQEIASLRALEQDNVDRLVNAKPVEFKDAVGRKFNLPFKLCRTWEDMERLVREAFIHVDVIGSHVTDGHYDLMGPESEIILPSVWPEVIQPGMKISMHMWPLPEQEPASEEKQDKQSHDSEHNGEQDLEKDELDPDDVGFDAEKAVHDPQEEIPETLHDNFTGAADDLKHEDKQHKV